ncbi:hypothetical protein ACLBX9_04765 [Methylobacterium sp. A49B]
MLSAAWLGLAVKLVASAAVVVIASMIAEISGPLGAAMIASLPVSAGPAYVLLALEHDRAFLAAAAHGGLVVLPGTAAFIVIYAFAASIGLVASLMSAMAGWAVIVWALQRADLPAPAALALCLVAFIAAAFVTRHLFAAPPVGRAVRRWWDVPARALLVAALVAAVLAFAQIFGPSAAGMTAAFPLTMTSLVVIVHRRLGALTSVAMLVNALPGMLGFSVGMAIVAEATFLGSTAALCLALAVGLAWNMALLRRATWRARN